MDKWLENFARASFRRSGDTAHDLKTPLNVAVLNLELLRMRLAKLTDAEDEKVVSYTAAIEAELRRLARIFDAFFVLSTPPKDDESVAVVPIASLISEAAKSARWETSGDGAGAIRAHESRMRQAVKLLFDGASKIFQADDRRATMQIVDGRLDVALSGTPASADLDVAKIFKFYYTDPSGNADLSLASARLIFETYGGELNAAEERGKVVVRLSVPLGDP